MPWVRKAMKGVARLRKASGSRQAGFDPEMSEWENPSSNLMLDILTQVGKQTWGSKTFQYPEEKKTRPYLTFAQSGISIVVSDSEIWTFPK